MAGDGNSIETFTVSRRNPRPVRFYVDLVRRWSPQLISYGAFGGMMFLYFTDWKIFMDKVPFYRKKFEEKDPIV